MCIQTWALLSTYIYFHYSTCITLYIITFRYLFIMFTSSVKVVPCDETKTKKYLVRNNTMYLSVVLIQCVFVISMTPICHVLYVCICTSTHYPALKCGFQSKACPRLLSVSRTACFPCSVWHVFQSRLLSRTHWSLAAPAPCRFIPAPEQDLWCVNTMLMSLLLKLLTR